MPNTIFMSAGESSGDLLGADLARALHQENPAYQLIGMGGSRMQAAGVDIVFDSKQLSVVGALEVIRHLPQILSTLHRIKKYLRETKPSLVILIDFPDTHFRIMKYAKKLGIPVLYYVSPQIWAWRSGRIKQIKKYVDHMAVLFSFEEKIYRDANVPVTFVGHPLAQIVKPSLSKQEAYAFFNLDSQHPIVALFPGSRRSEMENHLSIIIESTKEITQKIPNTQFVLVLADHFNETEISEKLPHAIKIVRHQLYDLLQITDAAIAVSGTVTLEIALMQVPLCIIYKMSPFSFWIAKKLIHLAQIGLCNIVLEKMVAKEFIQDDANAQLISAEIIKLITDQAYHDQIRADLLKIKDKISIAPEKSSEKVAGIVLNLLKRGI
jgi:lipid-A-disaccharide synthase